MKKKIAVMAVMLCTALLGTACAGEDTSDKDSVVLDQGEEESADQTKLNMIQPQAYSTVEGLKLKKGQLHIHHREIRGFCILGRNKARGRGCGGRAE